MRFEISEKIKTNKSEDEVLTFLNIQFKKIATDSARSEKAIKVKSIEVVFEAIKDDSTNISLKKLEDGWLLIADVELRPSTLYWILLIVGLFGWVFWLLPMGFYMHQKDAIKRTISDCFQRTKYEFEQSNAPVQPQRSIGEIGQLHELFKSGAITQQEFDQEKKKVLNKAA